MQIQNSSRNWVLNNHETVGIVASSFDLFHAGHVLMLAEAKEHCDRLVVALQSDPTLDRPEKNKPVQGLFERYVQVRNCQFVDDVIPYDTEADLYNLLAGYTWDIRFLGSDYYGRTDFTGYDLPIDIHYCHRNHDYSSSSLRDRIIKANA
jgi:glycerol-3-phosphate cytidylyltransferase